MPRVLAALSHRRLSSGRAAARSFVLLAMVLTLNSACAVAGEPVAERTQSISSSTAITRQTDDRGRQLPFVTKFPNRWSANNDGTSYEPCTYVPGDVLRRVGLDPHTATDVASSDHQTARGCAWKRQGEPRIVLEQFVADLWTSDGDLDGFKLRNSAGTTWRQDKMLDGRRVAVGWVDGARCSTYLISGDSVVVTALTDFTQVRPNTESICSSAVDITRATIPGIPS
jgi:hypothetical protein